MVDIGIDQAVSLVILVDDIECLSVPQSQEESLAVFRVVAEDAVKAA